MEELDFVILSYLLDVIQNYPSDELFSVCATNMLYDASLLYYKSLQPSRINFLYHPGCKCFMIFIH